MVVRTEQQSSLSFDYTCLSGVDVWLSQRQIAELFGVKTSIVADLIRHLYKTGELDKSTTVSKCRIVQQEGKREVVRELNCYNRKVIMAVGARVHSPQGEQYRSWTNRLIESQLDDGFYLDQARLSQDPTLLSELTQAVEHLCQLSQKDGDTQQSSADQLSRLYQDYQLALRRLFAFEGRQLTVRNATLLAANPLQLFEIKRVIDFLCTLSANGDSGRFGVHRTGELEAILQEVTACDGCRERYPSIEEKASQLLWLLIHRSPFEEGECCLAAFLFAWFLDSNGLLRPEANKRRVAANALVLMTLLVAESGEGQREAVTTLIASLINREN